MATVSGNGKPQVSSGLAAGFLGNIVPSFLRGPAGRRGFKSQSSFCEEECFFPFSGTDGSNGITGVIGTIFLCSLAQFSDYLKDQVALIQTCNAVSDKILPPSLLAEVAVSPFDETGARWASRVGQLGGCWSFP